MSCTKNGVLIKLAGHELFFMADLYVVGTAVVVRANGPLSQHNAFYKEQLPEALRNKPYLLMQDRPVSGFWREELGVFCVPADQLTPVIGARLPRERPALCQCDEFVECIWPVCGRCG